MDAGDARAQRIAKASGVLAGLLLLAAMLVTSAFGPAPVETTASAREIAVLSSPLGWLLDRSIRMRIAAVAFSIWGVVAYLRCTDRRARWILAAIAALLVAWMIAVIIKWKTASGALAIILWYAYYIPMSLIPVACAFLGAHVAGLDRTRRQRRMLAAALAVSLAFIVLVLTNDYHRWFFTFDTPTAGTLGEYSYGPAYRVFLVWSAVCYAAFFCCMGYAARCRLRLLLAPVVGVCLLGFSYAIAYVFRFEPILHINFSLAYALFVVCALELSFDLGLLPSAVSFSKIFDALPFELSVVDYAGRVFRATEAARPFSSESSALATRPDGAEGGDAIPVSWIDPANADLQMQAWPVLGGWAVLAQNIQGLNDERAELKKRSYELSRQKTMLEHDCEIAEFASGLASECCLADEVEWALASSLDEVSRIFDGLMTGHSDDPGNSDPAARFGHGIGTYVPSFPPHGCIKHGGRVIVLRLQRRPALTRHAESPPSYPTR